MSVLKSFIPPKLFSCFFRQPSDYHFSSKHFNKSLYWTVSNITKLLSSLTSCNSLIISYPSLFFLNSPKKKKKGFVWFTWIWMKTRSTHTWVDVSLQPQFLMVPSFPHFNAKCWRNEVTEHIILTTFWIWPIAFLL